MYCLKGMKSVMRKFCPLPLIVVLAIALLAACGGGDEPEPAATPSPAAAAPAEAQPVAAVAGDAANGQKIYSQLCIACHGPQGKGVQGLGKDLTTSTFVAEKSDMELVDFIKVGRDPGDPLNTTGVAMPPKGGNPALDDQDIADIVSFVRTIHQ
jgi:disulfide bond formation protein DsbB